MNYNLIFVATCCNHEYVHKLIASVVTCNCTISVCLIVVNQTKTKIENVIDTCNTDVIIIEHGEQANTSVARNIGIDYLLSNQLKSQFVGFPDDDSSFDSVFFQKMGEYVTRDKHINMVTDVYCTGTKVLFRRIKLSNNSILTNKNFNIVGAVNILLNFDTFSKVLYFDTRFGVNAKYGAGEDGDYFIRAVMIEPFYYINELYSFHPSGDSKYNKLSFQHLRRRLIGYASGGIALLCKHKMYFEAFILTFRALGGVINYLVKLKFKIAFAYFEAFFVRLFYLIKFTLFSVK